MPQLDMRLTPMNGPRRSSVEVRRRCHFHLLKSDTVIVTQRQVKQVAVVTGKSFY
jgi:hypothetical protein